MATIKRTLYCVAVKRGRTTKYAYSSKLKDAVGIARIRDGERFTFCKFEHAGWYNASINAGVLTSQRAKRGTVAA